VIINRRDIAINKIEIVFIKYINTILYILTKYLLYNMSTTKHYCYYHGQGAGYGSLGG
jgi:hypothetical protein